jgi:hypothetical protein
LYLLFFVLVLFDSLRFKNRKTVECFCIPKAFFFFVYLIIEVTDEFTRESDIFLWAWPWKIRRCCHITRAACQLICLGWILLAIVLAGRFIDITERYKFWAYSGVCLVAVSVVALLEFVFKNSQWLLRNSVPFVVPFSIQNFFVLLMAIFHWPYELVVDQQYEDSAAGEVQEDLIVEG